MLGLPKSTELFKQLPKTAIYSKFQMNSKSKEKIDSDISRINIVNEISPSNVNISAGGEIKSFFVVQVILKKKDFDEKNINTISKLIPQNMLFILEYENEIKLAIYHTKLIQTPWQAKDSLLIELKGLNLDAVWENIIIHIGGIQIEDGNTLKDQIAVDEKRKKLEKEINRLDKLARKEKQPKKKFELVQEINRLKKELEEV